MIHFVCLLFVCLFSCCLVHQHQQQQPPWERESPAKPVPSPRLGGRSNSACLNNHADEPPTDLFIMHGALFQIATYFTHNPHETYPPCIFPFDHTFPVFPNKKQCCVSCLWSCSAPCLDLTFVFLIDTFPLFDALFFVSTQSCLVIVISVLLEIFF